MNPLKSEESDEDSNIVYIHVTQELSPSQVEDLLSLTDTTCVSEYVRKSVFGL